MEDKFGKYKVKYTEKEEYQRIWSDIFVDGVYYFKLENKSPRILDLGGHIGLATIYFKDTYPDAIISVLEPNPILFELLSENIHGNGLTDVELLNFAADTQRVNKPFHISAQSQWYSTGGYAKGTWKGTEDSKEITVQTVNTLDLLNEDIDILKIDIEGYEYTLLKHIEEKLKIVKNLVIEYHPNQYKIENLIDILTKHYTKIVYIQEGKETVKPNKRELMIIKCSN